MTILTDKYRGTAMYNEVRDLLIDAARQRSVIQYHPRITSIMDITEPGGYMRGELGQILGEICEDEDLAGRPMLSAVAISSENRPGKGFFDLARELGKPVGHDEDAFWQAELQALYEYWCHDSSSLLA